MNISNISLFEKYWTLRIKRLDNIVNLRLSMGGFCFFDLMWVAKTSREKWTASYTEYIFKPENLVLSRLFVLNLVFSKLRLEGPLELRISGAQCHLTLG